MKQEILQAYLREKENCYRQGESIQEQKQESEKTGETPAYIFDLDMLKSRVCMMKDIVGRRAEICFAMKANPFLIGPLKDTADKFEVCSPGEFHICESAGIPMEKIVLSGVNKEKCDISYVMRTYGNAGVYTIESGNHLDLLEACAKEADITVRALVRVTSGNQFGVDEEEVYRIVSKRYYYPHVRIEGIQCYSGTQKKKFSKIEKELNWLDGIITRLKEEYGYETEVLEYGPGFYVPYFENEEEADDPALLGQFANALELLNFQGKITLEMGRYIAAYCGYYITRIVDQKINHGQNYCIVDGGLNHLNYYGQAMAMKMPHHQHIPARILNDGQVEWKCTTEQDLVEKTTDMNAEYGETKQEKVLWNICGSLCTVNDVLVKQMPLENANIGDALVFERVGAYSVTEGIYLFLSRRMPRILFWSEKDGFVEVRKAIESYPINTLELSDTGRSKNITEC